MVTSNYYHISIANCQLVELATWYGGQVPLEMRKALISYSTI
jgi:hypothetical protein